jgi:hypothetical protein
MRIQLCAPAVAVAFTACAGPELRLDRVTDADSLPVLTLREDRRIGSVNDADAGFAQVGTMDVGREGNVYVFEARDRQIRVYGRDGRLLRTIGRSGSGPGEFTAVSAMGVLGDTLWAVERTGNSGRILLFTVAGEHLSTSVSRAAVMVRPRAMVRSGTFSSEAVVRTQQLPRLLFDATGNAKDTVGWDPPDPPRETTAWTSGSPANVSQDGINYQVPRPPGDQHLRVSFDDGSALIRRRRPANDGDAEFTVTRFTTAGDTGVHLRFRYRPGRYEGAVLDTIAMRPVVRAGYSEAAFRAVRALLDYPPFQSPIYTAWAAQDSSLWMRREDNAGPHFRWIVVRADGLVRGVVHLPRSTTPLWARADTLWATAVDTLGVPWLVRHTIRG